MHNQRERRGSQLEEEVGHEGRPTMVSGDDGAYGEGRRPVGELAEENGLSEAHGGSGPLEGSDLDGDGS